MFVLMTMSDVELLIFDLDGTLIDSKKDIANCVNWTLEELGLESIDHEIIYSYVGHGVRQLIEGSLGPGHHEDRFKEAMEIFDRYYLNHLLDHTKLFDGIEQVLDHYHTCKLAVVTNKPQHYTDPIMTGLGLTDRFGAILGREATKNFKPHPEPIEKVLSLLPADKDKTVMIGDTEVDIEAGKNAGVKTCGVTYGFGKVEILQEANPDYLIDKASDLLPLFS